MAENMDQSKVLTRTSTVAKINQFMQDYSMTKQDELDMVTFIFAAQAIKPGADQEELMKIFSDAGSQEEEDEAPEKLAMDEKLHKLLKRVSTADPALARQVTEKESANENVILGFDAPPESDEEDQIRRSSSRRRSVYQQAEIDAAEEMARTTQKLEIAAEMILQGHSMATVVSVTGLEESSIKAIASAKKVESPLKGNGLSDEKIKNIVRLAQLAKKLSPKNVNLLTH